MAIAAVRRRITATAFCTALIRSASSWWMLPFFIAASTATTTGATSVCVASTLRSANWNASPG